MFAKFVTLLALLTCLFFLFYGGDSTSRFSLSQKEQQIEMTSGDIQFERLRRRMVDAQLRGRDIRDTRVLAAMEKVDQ